VVELLFTLLLLIALLNHDLVSFDIPEMALFAFSIACDIAGKGAPLWHFGKAADFFYKHIVIFDYDLRRQRIEVFSEIVKYNIMKSKVQHPHFQFCKLISI
jgi:hypothetical protein